MTSSPSLKKISVAGCCRAVAVILLLHPVNAFTTSQYSHGRTACPTPKFRWNSRAVTFSPFSRRYGAALGEDVVNYDPYDVANNIEPETKTLPNSLAFYAQFIVKHYAEQRRNRKSTGNVKGQRRAMWQKLNEQRKNIVSLAGYTSDLVKPSFLFLFLGALMTSVVPSYYSKCIHCVSTLSATHGQLVEALIGLGVSSILAALFTGLRGSLFWIGGKLTTLVFNVTWESNLHMIVGHLIFSVPRKTNVGCRLSCQLQCPRQIAPKSTFARSGFL